MTRAPAALALAAALAVAGPGASRAQGGTAEVLGQAHAFYETLDIERALPLLRQVLSPSWPFEVSPDQRVDAYKYLGAALAIAGKGDSAVLFFRAALERDAFTDLDPTRFTPAQLALFVRARRLTFAVAARPIAAGRYDPRTQQIPFTIVATHRAAVVVDLRPLAGGPAAVVYQGDNDGLRDLDWNGLQGDGRLAAPGRYALTVVGRSLLQTATDSATVYFDLTHEVEPLEDTAAALQAADLLPERRPASAATGDLLKGAAVAGAAWVVADRLPNRALRGGGGTPVGAPVFIGAGVVTGVASFFYHRRHREIPENIVMNSLRRGVRQTANAQILARNQERIARTAIVIAPAAGTGP
jgi:hypothetical protein